MLRGNLPVPLRLEASPAKPATPGQQPLGPPPRSLASHSPLSGRELIEQLQRGALSEAAATDLQRNAEQPLHLEQDRGACRQGTDPPAVERVPRRDCFGGLLAKQAMR